MHLVMLSGGSGKRLWPLSNDIRSKQFIRFFKKEDGTYESMLERMYRQVKIENENSSITIATGKSQVSAIQNQLGDKVNICVEPSRKDTYPAIVLACAYLRDVQGVGEEEVVVICPVDPYVDQNYFKELFHLAKEAEHGDGSLYLMGMEPTYPSEKYGYILPTTRENISQVHTFKEKPDALTASQYLEQGALWNGGIFAFKLGYLLEKAKPHLEGKTYQELYQSYDSLEKISFDYAVVEKEKNCKVLRFAGEWRDLGTWNTLTEAMEEKTIGKAMYNDKCENLHIINELNIPILCMGCKDMIVSASPEGILVSNKGESSYIKPYVEQIDQQIMFAEKSWGNFQVVDIEAAGMTIKVTLNPGNQMNYHYHENRREIWTVLSGKGYVIRDGLKRAIQSGDVIEIPKLCKHTIYAETELKVMEVQIGEDISVHDKIKC